MADGKHGGVLGAWTEGSTAVLRLQRPHVHNALDRALLAALHAELQRLEADPSIRAVILTGQGASFCAGDDLQTVRDSSPEEFRRSIEELQGLTARLLRRTHPVICAFNGPAYGAGLELSLACDIRLATPNFACSTPEVKLGLIATNAATVLLPHLVGPARARRMLFSGARMDARWCVEAGLIDEIVGPQVLMDRALALAAEFAEGGPGAVAETRRLLNAPLRDALDAALIDESATCVAARESHEGREGVESYFASRAPEWRS